MASICEMPELKISRSGTIVPDGPSSITPSAAIAALIDRSTARARKV